MSKALPEVTRAFPVLILQF